MPSSASAGGAKDDALTELRQGGTYRAPDGTLVHCVVRGHDFEIDVEEGALARVSFLERDLVILSDDPCWPDRWDRNRGVLWPTD